MKKYIVLLLALVMNVAAWAGDGSFEDPYEFTIGENKEFVADKWYKYEPESSIKLIFTAEEGVEWTGGVYYDEEWCDVEFSYEEENIYTFMRNETYYLKFDQDVTLNVTRPDEEEVTANMQITSAGVATFCAPFDVTIPAGVKAYTASIGGANEYVILTKIEDNVIGAGSPVVLIGNACVYNFNGIPVVEDADGPNLKGLLNKDYVTVTDNVGNYVLQNGSDGVGWYAVRTAGILVGKNRCYLCADGGHNAKAFIGMSFDDDPTAIHQIATEAKTMADGKYLVNGKLVIIKSGNAYDIDGIQIK